MRIVSTSKGPGHLTGDTVTLWDTDRTVNQIIAAGPLTSPPPVAGTVALEDVEILTPVVPAAIHSIGLNFRDHAAETGLPIPEHPLPITIRAGAAGHPGSAIVLPLCAPDAVDYEAEICIVIGRPASNVAVENALAHVAGLTLGNDVTARDIAIRALLNREFEVSLSKSFDTFKPFGPAIVTLDEIDDLSAIDISLRLNDEVVQDATSAGWIFDVAQVVSYLSQFATLEPGDVIFTGSPAGVGMTRGRMLRSGDRTVVSSNVLGISLTNDVAAGSGR
jgi:2-keto-4-pentenoate hydratase/2-oxohepta-3-ene-1,7-dioic acid hydratase in catechol pathway